MSKARLVLIFHSFFILYLSFPLSGNTASDSSDTSPGLGLSIFISGDDYKGIGILPELTFRIKRHHFSAGAVFNVLYAPYHGHHWRDGLSGVAVSYAYSLKTGQSLYLAIRNQFIIQEFSHNVNFPFPSDNNFRERTLIYEQYLSLSISYSRKRILSYYAAPGIGVSYGRYTKTGLVFNEKWSEVNFSGILILGVNLKLRPS